MRAAIQNASLHTLSRRDIHRVAVYPKAEGGAGAIYLFYSEGGEEKSIAILLTTIDSAIISNDMLISPETLALIPEPITPKEGA